MTLRLTVLAAALVLAGCGGGGSSTPSAPYAPVAPSAPVAPAPTRNGAPLMLYFGVAAKQLEETADHCSCVYSLDWGSWDTDHDAIANRIIADLQEAKARGFTTAIIAVGFTMFTKAFAYRGTADLIAFRARVEACGGPKIVGISIIDEPDMNGISDAVMTRAHTEAKAVWPGVKVFVVYGDHGTPGASAADVIGRDAYPNLVTVPVRPDQQQWIFAGGADPWRVDPTPFVNYAAQHAEVAAVCAFMWIDRPVGQDSGPGIRSNGLASVYRSAFLAARKNTV